jgi:mono/diheme cytochrome c family protein
MKKRIIAFVGGLLLLPLVGIAAAWLGLWPSRAISAPSRWETAFTERTLRASLARYAVDLKNPVTVSDETILAGMKIFRTNCAGCHGEFRHLSHWGTRGFYPRVPQFADVPPSLNAPEMFLVVKNGIRYTGMGAWDGMLSDVEIWQVVTFLNNLKSLPEPVAAEWETKR